MRAIAPGASVLADSDRQRKCGATARACPRQGPVTQSTCDHAGFREASKGDNSLTSTTTERIKDYSTQDETSSSTPQGAVIAGRRKQEAARTDIKESGEGGG
jgi:hypothetical protein